MMASQEDLVCNRCKGKLTIGESELTCAACELIFPYRGQIADFSQGAYYDNFPGPEVLSEENRRGLENEKEGDRIEGFYLPLIRQIASSKGASGKNLRVLDSGCGNGESVDVLNRLGFDAWGHDLSALRKWQWSERERPDRLVVAAGDTLPFSKGFFDVLIASGILEHIGVSEQGGQRYQVQPLPDRDERRFAFLAELVRVLAPDGRLFLDSPNGQFPIDFWHGVKPGGARFHSLSEGFLPTVPQIRALCRRIDVRLAVRALSPEGRLRFNQVSAHWYGRLFRYPMAVLHRLMSVRSLRFLASSPINPYLVVEISRVAETLKADEKTVPESHCM